MTIVNCKENGRKLSKGVESNEGKGEIALDFRSVQYKSLENTVGKGEIGNRSTTLGTPLLQVKVKDTNTNSV